LYLLTLVLVVLCTVSPFSNASWLCTGPFGGQNPHNGNTCDETCSALGFFLGGSQAASCGGSGGTQCLYPNMALVGSCSGSDGEYDGGCEEGEVWDTPSQECVSGTPPLTPDELRQECINMKNDSNINWIWPRRLATT